MSADGQVESGLGGLAHHEAGDGRARTQLKRCTAILWSVQWNMGENDTTCAVLQLAEVAFGVGLGAIGGDHFGAGPVVAVGEEDPFAEDTPLRGPRGPARRVPGQAQPAGRSPVRVTCSTRATQRGIEMAAISAWTWARGRRVWRRASRAARAAQLPWALARVWSKPRDWRPWKVGEWVTTTRRSAPRRCGGGLGGGQARGSGRGRPAGSGRRGRPGGEGARMGAPRRRSAGRAWRGGPGWRPSPARRRRPRSAGPRRRPRDW